MRARVKTGRILVTGLLRLKKMYEAEGENATTCWERAVLVSSKNWYEQHPSMNPGVSDVVSYLVGSG